MYSSLLMAVLVVASCSDDSTDNQEKDEEEKVDVNQDLDAVKNKDTTKDADPADPYVAPADKVLELSETIGNMTLKAKLNEGEISAKVEIVKGGSIDNQAQGVVVFRIASVTTIDGEELEFLDPTVAPCDEELGDEDEELGDDIDICDDDPTCYDSDNCPVEKQLVNGVATLFSDTESQNIIDYVATDEAIEVQATYKNPPSAPQTIKKRFELNDN